MKKRYSLNRSKSYNMRLITITIILKLQHSFGVYGKWVNDNFDPKYSGYMKYEAMVDEWYSNGKYEKGGLLKI